MNIAQKLLSCSIPGGVFHLDEQAWGLVPVNTLAVSTLSDVVWRLVDQDCTTLNRNAPGVLPVLSLCSPYSQRKRQQFSRRRRHYEDKDIDYINDRNAHFNKKIDRAFSKYTQEIRANLERGTALPDH